MSVGGGDLKLNYSSQSFQEYVSKAENKRRVSAIKSEIASLDQVAAYIDSKKCINCGTCREACPQNAISEQQRIICHMCPACTERPTMSPQACEALTEETSCTTKCPLGISPQGYVGLTKIGKYKEAYDLIWQKNPLLSVCASVCTHPCQDGCKRGILVDHAIEIREIKKFLVNNVDAEIKPYQVLYDEKVAVIGAGPAGLAAAHHLASNGYEVTVFEGSNEAGGMLVKGIPEFRLDRETVRKDIERLEACGMDIRYNSRFTPATIDNLRDEYDAIIVAAGTPVSKELKIPGFRLAGVMGAMTFMRQINHHMNPQHHLGQIFKFEDGRAVVLGGGAVAMDVARTALRAGASKVTVVCPEEGDAIPAHPWEVEEAKAEGVEFIEGYSPVMFTEDLFPHLTGVKFERVTSMGVNESGRFEIKTDPEDSMQIPCEWCVVAIGQAPDMEWRSIEAPDVFLAGEIAQGRSCVIDALSSGKDCAIKVDAALRGREVKNPMNDHKLHMAEINERIFPYNRTKNIRPSVPKLDMNERLTSFKEVEGVFTQAEVLQETKACLSCGYEMVDPEKCVACGLCQRLCPKGDVITMIVK